MVAEALTDEATRKEAILRLRDSLKQRKTVVQTLEFAARVDREIGLGSEERVGGVTIIFQTNLKPGSLKRPVLCQASIWDGAGPTAMRVSNPGRGTDDRRLPIMPALPFPPETTGPPEPARGGRRPRRRRVSTRRTARTEGPCRLVSRIRGR